MAVLDLPVFGSSLMPYCHFELEPSDYLSRRTSADLMRGGGGAFASAGSSVDLASTRVIEFSSCGIGLKNVKYVNAMCVYVNSRGKGAKELYCSIFPRQVYM